MARAHTDSTMTDVRLDRLISSGASRLAGSLAAMAAASAAGSSCSTRPCVSKVAVMALTPMSEQQEAVAGSSLRRLLYAAPIYNCLKLWAFQLNSKLAE